MISKIIGFFTGAQGTMSFLPILLIVFLGGIILHERLASRALSQAEERGTLAERARWEEAQRQAEAQRIEERRRAESAIRELEIEAAALRGEVEAQEAELERYIQEHEARQRPSGDPTPRTLLERGLVRQLNRQGRPADKSPTR